MTRLGKFPAMPSSSLVPFLLLLAVVVVPGIECQLALLSPGIFSSHSMFGFTNYGNSMSPLSEPKESPPSPANSSSGMESEIAAVFRGVAYGAVDPTVQVTTTTTTSTTTPSTTTSRTTQRSADRSEKFIGQKADAEKILDDFYSTSRMPPLSFSEKESAAEDHSDIAVSYHIREPEGFIGSFDIEELTSQLPVSSTPPVQQAQKRRSEGYPYRDIKDTLGRAWTLHVNFTAGLFSLSGILCLFGLCRISACCHFLPRGYFVTLHLLTVLATSFRCILFFHDPYGADGTLPRVLSDLLYDTVSPCLVTAFAVLLLVVLRAARLVLLPFNVQSPSVLAALSGALIGTSVVIDIAAGVLESGRLVVALKVGIRSFVTVYAILLSIGYLVAFPRIETAAQRQQGEMARLTFTRVHLDGGAHCKRLLRPSLTCASRLAMMGSIFVIVLSCTSIYSIVHGLALHAVDYSQAWAWLAYSGLERVIEFLLCLTLLTAAFSLTQGRPRGLDLRSEQKIFSVFNSFSRESGVSDSSDLYRSINEKSSFIKNGTARSFVSDDTVSIKRPIPVEWTLQSSRNYQSACKPQSGAGSVTSDFQYRPAQSLQTDSLKSSSMLVNDSGFVRFRTTIDPEMVNEDVYKRCIGTPVTSGSLSVTRPNNSGYAYFSPVTATLPYTAGHISKSTTCTPVRYPHRGHFYTSGLDVVSPKATPEPLAPPRDSPCFEVASYCDQTLRSTGSNVYSVPHSTVPRNYCRQRFPLDMPQLHRQIASGRGLLTPDGGDSFRFDPSTCSSQSEIQVDYLTDISSSNDALQYSPSQQAFSLPFRSRKAPHPDEARGSPVVFDSPSTCSSDERVHRNSGALDLLKLSTNSLNEVFKGQSVILGKLVGANSQGYAPLDVEDSSPSQEASTGFRRTASSSEIMETLENCVIPGVSPMNERHSPMTSL